MTHMLRRLAVALIAFSLLGAATGCDLLYTQKSRKGKEPEPTAVKTPPKPKPVKAALNEPAKMGALTVIVKSATLEFPILKSNEGQRYLTRPALKVVISVTNNGKKPGTYTPNHVIAGGDATATARVETAGGNVVTRMDLSKDVRVLGRQLPKVTLDPQQTISDVYLFEAKDVIGQTLFWRAPGAVFGHSADLEVELPVLSKGAFLPDPHDGTKPLVVGKYEVQFGTPQVAYLKLQRKIEEKTVKAWSNNPTLVIPVTYTNKSDKTLVFKPAYLKEPTKDLSLWRIGQRPIPPSVVYQAEVVGRLGARTSVEPEKKVSDLLLFSRPSTETKTLILHLGKGSFGQEGILRVKFDFEFKEPRRPKGKPR